MTEKLLGKIETAEYGEVRDREFLFGLQLTFRFGGEHESGCGDGLRYTVNLSKHCKWDSPEKRMQAITESIDFLHKILFDAKCHYVSELKNKPVEVTIKDYTFKDFRILTEVL